MNRVRRHPNLKTEAVESVLGARGEVGLSPGLQFVYQFASSHVLQAPSCELADQQWIFAPLPNVPSDFSSASEQNFNILADILKLSLMCLVMVFFFPPVPPEGAFQNHSRLRTPPLPLSHSHSPSHQHHAASINSLNRGNYTPRSNPSPAPTDSSAPPEGPASGQDSGSAQDNWLLNSNIPLETRYRANVSVFYRIGICPLNIECMFIVKSAQR